MRIKYKNSENQSKQPKNSYKKVDKKPLFKLKIF